MFKSTSLTDWENLVKKQLKTEDIYKNLSAVNLEGVTVRPFYDATSVPLQIMPKVAESTHLVSKYAEKLEEEVLAFLLEENVENLSGKTLFIDNKALAEHIMVVPENQYFSLIDAFNAETGILDVQLAKEMLAKDFNRNLCVDVAFIQNCGASIIQQITVALGKCKELLEEFGAEILNKIVIKVAVGPHYFFEISKIRALKLVFNQLSKEYGSNEIPFIYAETSLRNKTVNDAENNLIRSTLELSAAMLGGADAVYSKDFRTENNTPLSEEISFKQQIVLAYESIINVFDDAANGSYFVEDITRQLAQQSWEKFLKIKAAGGYSVHFVNLKNEILQHAEIEHQAVADGKIKLVGCNMYPKLDATRSAGSLYNEAALKAVRWSEIYE